MGPVCRAVDSGATALSRQAGWRDKRIGNVVPPSPARAGGKEGHSSLPAFHVSRSWRVR